ncbi:hypothetical protein BYT27DRAFT_7250331, partial [Phlegmacium glaucopus]
MTLRLKAPRLSRKQIHEIIHNPADVRTLFTPEFHDTPTAVELETATYTAPDTPRVSAISDNTNTSDSTAETVQLPSTVSHELFTITNESTLIPAEEILNAQSEVQVLEETFNEAKADTGVADVDIVPETTPSAAIDDTNDLTISSTSIISSESPAEFVTVAEETQLLQDDGSLPVTDETVVQADAVESMEEESAARSQLESEMVVLPSSDSDIQDATPDQFEVTSEEIKSSDTELDFTATDVTPSISSTEATAPMTFNDSQAQEEPEVVTDSLEQSTWLSLAAPILSGMAILAADVMEAIDEITTTIVSPSVEEDDPIGEIPVVTSTIPADAQHVLLSTESRDVPNIELEDEIIPLAAAEAGPEAVEALVAPVSESLELQTQHSVEETTEVSVTLVPSAGRPVNYNKLIKEIYAAVEAPNETEAEVITPIEGQSVPATEVPPTDAQLEPTATTIPMASYLDDVSAPEVESEQLEEYTTIAASLEPLYEPHSTPENRLISTVEHDTPVEPVEVQLEAPPAAEESGGTAEAIIPAIVEESPSQIEEERLVLADLQDDTTPSEAACPEPLEAGPVLIEEEPATIVESEPDILHMATSVPVVPIPASDVDVA